jgi:hypothetical protein
LAAAYDD